MRLIDADSVFCRYYGEFEKQDICDGEQDRDWIKKCVEEAETVDAVPVVRCLECRHYNEIRTKKYGNLICRCTRMGKYNMDYPVRPYDFCSYGEKTDNSTGK